MNIATLRKLNEYSCLNAKCIRFKLKLKWINSKKIEIRKLDLLQNDTYLKTRKHIFNKWHFDEETLHFN